MPTGDPDATLRLRSGDTAEIPPDAATAPEIGRDVDDLAGAVVGGYRILRELGRGGMGVVYLAEDAELRRKVALKILPGGAADASARARFRREAEAASRLDHPNLCGVLGAGSEGGVRWIAMRFVQGTTLARRIADDRAERDAGPTGESGTRVEASRWREIVALVETTARAVHAAHEVNVVHRDLKPQNIMVQEDGSPVVLDFGLAQDGSDEGLTATGDILGTPQYMAPEQVRGDSAHADRRADVWALGVVLYETLTLRRPFEAATREALWRAIVEQDPPPLRASVRGSPSDLEAVVAVALAKDPNRRYATAQLFADDLRAVLETRPVAARAPSGLEKLWKLALRRPAAAALVALTFVGGPIGAAQWTAARSRDERMEQLAVGRLDDARRALEFRRTAEALAALDAAKTLAAPADQIEPIAAAVARRVRLDAIETVAQDADLDPDGSRALALLDEADRSGDGGLETAVLRALVLARTRGTATAAAALKEFDRGTPGVGAAPFADLARRFAEDEAASRPAGRTAGRAEPQANVADPDLAYFGALLLSARGNDREALSALESLLESAPQRHWFAWAAAEAASRLHDFHAALAFAGRARAQGGAASPERLGRYSAHLRRAGRITEATTAAAEAVRLGGESPVLLLHLGNAYADAKRSADAEPLLRRAVALDPRFVEARGALAAVLFERGRYLESAEESRAALSIREDGGIRVNLGNALIEADRFPEAEIELRRAVELRPDSAFAWNSYGTSLMHQSRFEESERAFARAVDILPNYAQGLASLGVMLHRRGDTAGAERRLRAAHALSPSDVPIRYRLACVLFDDRRDEALELLEGAREINPDDADVLAKIAEAWAAQGRFVEAAELSRRATDLRPEATRAWLVRALTAAGQGQFKEGEAFMRRAIEADPSDPRLQIGLLDSFSVADPIENYARLVECLRLDPSLDDSLSDRLAKVRDRLLDTIDDPPDDPTPEDAALAAHPLTVAISAAASGDRARIDAAKKLVEALPDGVKGSSPALIRAAALAALAALR